MKPGDLCWLAGAMWFGLGVAHDHLGLQIFALGAWLAGAIVDRRARRPATYDCCGGQRHTDNCPTGRDPQTEETP